MLIAGLSVIVFVALVVIWITMVAPQTLTVCPTGCPFAQIQKAVDAVRSGSTLNVQAGTYREDLQITKSLYIIGTEGAVLEGQIAIAKTENVSLTALTVHGPVHIAESRQVVLKGNTVSQSQGVGIAVRSSTEVSLLENTITANSGDGILIESSHVQLSQNTIGGNKGYGIHADTASQLSGEGNRNGFRVPDNFPTIQAAIDAWQASMAPNDQGDVSENVPAGLLKGEGVLFIGAGVYNEQLTIDNKTLRIRGAGRESVFIDGTGLGDADGFTLRGEVHVTIENLTVRNFRDDGVDAEGQIELTLRDVALIGNGSTGMEIAHNQVRVRLVQSVIRHNRNYGLWATSAGNIIECKENSVLDNGSDYGGLGETEASAIAQKCQ
jgi:parallel beta-helix repeat protein